MPFFSKLLGGSKTPTKSDHFSPNLQEAVTREQALETSTQAMIRSSKKLADAFGEFDAMTNKFGHMTDSVVYFQENFTTDDRLPQRQEHDQFRNSMKGLGEFGKILQKQIGATLQTPLKKYSKIFPAVAEALKHHERLAQDCEKLEQKCDKLRMMSGDPGKLDKLERQKATAMKNLEASNASLPIELPMLCDKRVDFFDPCLEALVQAQVRYFESCAQVLETISSTQNVNVSDEEYNNETQRLLNNIRNLKITV